LWTLALAMAIVLVTTVLVATSMRNQNEPADRRLNPPAMPPRMIDSSGTMAEADAPVGRGKGDWIGVVVPRQSVEVAFTSAGLLSLVRVEIGDTVRAGAVLAALDTTAAWHRLRIAGAELEVAEARLQEAVGESTAAFRQRERANAMRLRELISDREMEEAEVRLTTAVGEARAMRAAVHGERATVDNLRGELDRAVIRAGFSGVVAARYYDPGTVIDSYTPVLRIISTAVVCRLACNPDDARALSVGDEVVVHPSDSDVVCGARVVRIAPEIDVHTGCVLVEVICSSDGEQERPIKAGITIRGSRADRTSPARPSSEDAPPWR